MAHPRPYAQMLERLRAVGLRPTRQRLALARLLFEKGDRHVTADELHDEAGRAATRVSLATIYNTLNQFTAAGLLREVAVETGRTYFDTNISGHHHFYCEESGELVDIAPGRLQVHGLPAVPSGSEISGIDVVVRLRTRGT